MPDMPPLDVGGYMVGYLLEIGPVVASGMGQGPISHQEVLAWQALTGIVLQPWETRCLRRLSHEYLAESRKAEKRDAKAPWRLPEVSDDQKQKVANDMMTYFRRMAAGD